MILLNCITDNNWSQTIFGDKWSCDYIKELEIQILEHLKSYEDVSHSIRSWSQIPSKQL